MRGLPGRSFLVLNTATLVSNHIPTASDKTHMVIFCQNICSLPDVGSKWFL